MAVLMEDGEGDDEDGDVNVEGGSEDGAGDEEMHTTEPTTAVDDDVQESAEVEETKMMNSLDQV